MGNLAVLGLLLALGVKVGTWLSGVVAVVHGQQKGNADVVPALMAMLLSIALSPKPAGGETRVVLCNAAQERRRLQPVGYRRC